MLIDVYANVLRLIEVTKKFNKSNLHNSEPVIM